MRPEDVTITADDSVMVFGGGFGDEAYVTGSIELDGPAVLVHLTDAHPWEGQPPESVSLLIPPEVLLRLAAEAGPRMPAVTHTGDERDGDEEA